jgi:tryptophan synthase beta chain
LVPLLQDEHGQVQETHSIAPGLDYPGVGPEHAMLRDTGRARYLSVEDHQAVAALRECAAVEGIIPALESAHALAGARLEALASPGSRILVCLSGRGDKDLDIIGGLGGA